MATEQELKDLADQLRCPKGEHGVMVADNMNDTNIGMTIETIYSLGLRKGDDILELGPGNAGHLGQLLEMAEDIRYVGLDISPTMREEANKLNIAQVEKSIARFDLYDGGALPYEDGSFDKAFTVNTLYFWENPQNTLAELARVLKPKGLLVVTFASRQFMETLPFTQFGFTLYSKDEMIGLVKETPFHVKDMLTKYETVQSKVGDLVEREYYIAVLKKQVYNEEED